MGSGFVIQPAIDAATGNRLLVALVGAVAGAIAAAVLLRIRHRA